MHPQPGPRVERRLAAIFAADVAGYSRLMSQDEAGTLRALADAREIMDGLIAEHGGRIANTAGDSVLAEFPSAVDAVQCAVAVQDRLAEANAEVPEDRRLQLRIGIHLGDVAVRGGDLLGEGVNIAARLEGVAEPGGVCLSGAVHAFVRKALPLAYTDLGEQHVKNIDEPVRVFAVESAAAAARPSAPKPLPLPDKPSIAVLPFTNMSGDLEQEYFGDGLVEDIITALSRFRGLFVIARNSSFTYKGIPVDVRLVGRELGVRYVLEGSVRKAGNRLRITGQLIEAATGAHVWADRFDGALEDVFELQDRITQGVIAAIVPTLEQAEVDRARRKPTESLDAYDCYLRGLTGIHASTLHGNKEAIRWFYAAIEHDPEFAAAYGGAATCLAWRKSSGWVTDRIREMAETERLARRAAELGRNDAVALCWAAWALPFVVHDLDAGADLIARALALNANLRMAWHISGFIKVWLGEPETALDHFAKARTSESARPAALQHASWCCPRSFFRWRVRGSLIMGGNFASGTTRLLRLIAYSGCKPRSRGPNRRSEVVCGPLATTRPPASGFHREGHVRSVSTRPSQKI